MKIYYVEDQMDLATIITKYLVKEGYTVKNFYDGESVMPHINDSVDLWILDIMLPGNISGYDLIKEIKSRNKNAAIIFTSARDQDMDKIIGLELGSDDYIAKPYSPKELLLRIKAVLRRVIKPGLEVINHETYEINVTKREITENGELISLTNKEFELLLFFLKNINTPFEREQILDKVWGNNYYGSDRVVDDLLRRLRQKMPNLKIETIYGFGYKLLWNPNVDLA